MRRWPLRSVNCWTVKQCKWTNLSSHIIRFRFIYIIFIHIYIYILLVYIYMSIYKYNYIYNHSYIYIYLYIFIYIYIYLYIFIYIYIYLYIFIYIYIYLYLYIYIYIYIYIFIFIYLYIYIYLYMHIHTSTCQDLRPSWSRGAWWKPWFAARNIRASWRRSPGSHREVVQKRLRSGISMGFLWYFVVMNGDLTNKNRDIDGNYPLV